MTGWNEIPDRYLVLRPWLIAKKQNRARMKIGLGDNDIVELVQSDGDIR
jgi:hypothetical protein